MAGGKISARQKMINMMYLVLTALLALNVSKEIIKAFNLIENSLDNSTKNIVQKNTAVLGSLENLQRRLTRHYQQYKIVVRILFLATNLIQLFQYQMRKIGRAHV